MQIVQAPRFKEPPKYLRLVGCAEFEKARATIASESKEAGWKQQHVDRPCCGTTAAQAGARQSVTHDLHSLMTHRVPRAAAGHRGHLVPPRDPESNEAVEGRDVRLARLDVYEVPTPLGLPIWR